MIRALDDPSTDALAQLRGALLRETGTPLWSPHDLKHRRVSLLHAQGKSWAEIAELVGNQSAKLLADRYTHVLMDERELDYASIIAARLGALAEPVFARVPRQPASEVAALCGELPCFRA